MMIFIKKYFFIKRSVYEAIRAFPFNIKNLSFLFSAGQVDKWKDIFFTLI